MMNNDVLVEMMNKENLTLSDKFVLLNMIIEYVDINCGDDSLKELCFDMLDDVQNSIVTEYIEQNKDHVVNNLTVIDELLGKIKTEIRGN